MSCIGRAATYRCVVHVVLPVGSSGNRLLVIFAVRLQLHMDPSLSIKGSTLTYRLVLQRVPQSPGAACMCIRQAPRLLLLWYLNACASSMGHVYMHCMGAFPPVSFSQNLLFVQPQLFIWDLYMPHPVCVLMAQLLDFSQLTNVYKPVEFCIERRGGTIN